MAEVGEKGGSEQDDILFLRTVSIHACVKFITREYCEKKFESIFAFCDSAAGFK